jgi:hypothetical protein
MIIFDKINNMEVFLYEKNKGSFSMYRQLQSVPEQKRSVQFFLMSAQDYTGPLKIQEQLKVVKKKF